MLLASGFVLAYLFYRGAWTLNLVSPFATFLSIGLFVSELWMSALLLLYFFQVWKLEEPPARKPLLNRSVDVFVPTVNEPVEILRETLSSCNAMDYPHETYLLDDGNRESMRLLAEELGVHYITRENREGAKAGNLNHALTQTSGEFIVILDADHVPFRHLIDRLIGYFDDAKMGFVQSPHSVYNFDNVSGDWSPKTHQYWEDVNLFHDTVQIGKNHWNAACFCGSAAMFRRSSLESVGNFAMETVTEDLHTGMRIAARGWKSLAISEPLIVGQAPEDIHSFNTQRVRWGLGNLSVLHFDNPLTMRGLTLAQRFNYLGSILSWTVGLPLFFTFLVPIFVLLTTVSPIREVTPTYLLLLTAYLGSFLFAMEYVSGNAASLIGIQINLMSNFHAQLKAVAKTLFRKKRPQFSVTPKSSRRTHFQTSGWQMFLAVLPQLSVIMAGIIAIFWAGLNLTMGMVDYPSGFIAGSLVMLFFIWLALISVNKSLRCFRRKRRWHYPAVLPVAFRKGNLLNSAPPTESSERMNYGVSFFFNDQEIEWISSTPLERGDHLALVLTAPLQTLEVDVLITEAFLVRKGYHQARGWFYRGEIQNPSNEQLTHLDEIALKYIVPRILEQNYCSGERQWIVTVFQSLVPFGRFLYRFFSPPRVPFVIHVHTVQNDSVTVVEDYNAQTFSFVLPYDLPVDAPLELVMEWDEPLHCSLQPNRVEPFRLAGNTFYRYHVSTEKMEAGVRERFGDFLFRAAALGWGQAIDHVQVRNSILYDAKIVSFGFVITFLLLGFVSAVYLYDKNDDIFMEHTARFETVPSDVLASRTRLVEILTQMESSQEADLNRWMRLYDAAVRIRDPEVSAQAADAIADLYTNRGNRTKAAEWKMVSAIMYFRLSNRREDMILQLNDIRITGGEKLLTPEKRYEYYMMRARAAAEKNDALTMERFYREALYLNPENEKVMAEWFSSLLTMKKHYDAVKQVPHGPHDAWVSDYQRVLEEFQAMVRSLPKDNDFVSQSAMLSEATDQHVSEAITLLEKKSQTEPLEEEDQKRLIRLLVKEKRYAEAFPQLRLLDDKIPDTMEFLRLFWWTATPLVSQLSEVEKSWTVQRSAALLRSAGERNFSDWAEEDFVSATHFLMVFGMTADLERVLRVALQRIPRTSSIHKDLELQMAMLLREQKRFQEAETFLEELLPP
ncbi:MAG: glycosyltransferase [Thermoguttaceae bacterium]